MYRPRSKAYSVPGFWHNVIQGRQYPSGAPRPAGVPPWGIHTEDPREAHHGAALADDMAAGAALAGFHNELNFRTPPLRRRMMTRGASCIQTPSRAPRFISR